MVHSVTIPSFFFLSLEKCLHLIQVPVHYSYSGGRKCLMIVVVISANDRPDSIDLLGSKQTGQVGVYEPLELTNMTHLYTVSSNQYKNTFKLPQTRSPFDITPHRTPFPLTDTSPSTVWRRASRWCWRWRRELERISGKICQSWKRILDIRNVSGADEGKCKI